MRSDIAPGGRFPDYELPDHDNNPRKLSEIQGDDPMIFTLARATTARRSTSSTSSWPRSIPRSRWRTPRSPLSRLTPHHTLQEFRNSVGAQWPPSQIRSASSRDLSTPGLCEAWEAGDLSPFHGWNKPGTGSRTAEESRSYVGAASGGSASS
jgi:hypothetical protein